MEKFRDKYRIPSSRLQNWDYGWNAPYFVTICTANKECYFGDIVNREMHLSDIGKIAQKFWLEIPNHFPFVILDAFVVMPNHVHGIIIIDKPDDERGGGWVGCGGENDDGQGAGDVDGKNDDGQCADREYGDRRGVLDGTDGVDGIDGMDGVDGAGDVVDAGWMVETPKLGVSTAPPTGHSTHPTDPTTPPTGHSIHKNPKNEKSGQFPKNPGGKNPKWKPGTLGVIINQYKRICTINARKIIPCFGWQSRFHDHIIRDDESYQRIRNYIINNPQNWEDDVFFS